MRFHKVGTRLTSCNHDTAAFDGVGESRYPRSDADMRWICNDVLKLRLGLNTRGAPRALRDTGVE